MFFLLFFHEGTYTFIGWSDLFLVLFLGACHEGILGDFFFGPSLCALWGTYSNYSNTL